MGETQIIVRVLKFAGETGLRKPGSVLAILETKAEAWIAAGIVEAVILPFDEKELKAKPETKELKLKVKTKTKSK